MRAQSRPFRAGDLGLAVADPMAVSESPTVSRSASKRARPSEPPPHEVTAQFEYAFYLDLLATGDAPNCLNAFRHLEEIARFVKVLGTFPRDGLLLPVDSDTAAKKALQPLARTSLECPLRIAVIGFGTFGQFLARRWVRRGHVVHAQSRTDYSDIASTIGVNFVTSVAELADEPIDCIVLSVSILSFEKERALPTLAPPTPRARVPPPPRARVPPPPRARVPPPPRARVPPPPRARVPPPPRAPPTAPALPRPLGCRHRPCAPPASRVRRRCARACRRAS